jgi:hypothetical protein
MGCHKSVYCSASTKSLGDLDRMHKQSTSSKIVNKLVLSSLDVFLLTGVGFFGDMKKQKTKFNPNPFPNAGQKEDVASSQIPKEKNVDLHLGLTKRIDELILENKDMAGLVHDPFFTNEKDISTPLSNVVEIRGPSSKKPVMPTSRNQLSPNKFNNDIGHMEEFFEVEIPKANADKKEKNEDVNSWMLNEKGANKTFQGVGKIKVRHKEGQVRSQHNEGDDFTRRRLDLERTKKEIEEKKQALVKALEEEKQKELELKKLKELKLKEERLKQLELKKKQKEEKMKQRQQKQLLKLQKKTEKELMKQERLKLLEDRKREISDLHKKEPEPGKLEVITNDKKETITDAQILDQDVAKLLPIIDSLFDNLPKEIVEKFVESEDFQIYEKVMLKYSNK